MPRAVFEQLMEETMLAKTLARLTKNKLLSLRESQNLHIQTVGNTSMKNHYALHPVICENDFFRKPLQKDDEGYFIQPESAGNILILNENTAETCWQKAMAAYKQNYFAHAIALFECAELIYENLTKKQNFKDLENNYAAMLMNKGVALDSLGRLNEAIENYDFAINIRKPLVEVEGRKELADDLAMALANKANVLAQQERFKEAVDYFDAAANLWIDAVQSGLDHLLPNLMKLFPMTVGMLIRIGDWNGVAERILLAFDRWGFTMENDIPEAIKQNTGQEFEQLLFTLCQTSQKNRERIYEACDDNADMVRETVEDFCKQMQQQ